MGLDDKIKKLLEERKMSQRDFAEKADISQATASRILNGAETNVRRETLERIAEALEVTAAYLIGEEQTPEVKDLFRGLEKLTPKQRDLMRGIMKQLLEEKRQKK